MTAASERGSLRPSGTCVGLRPEGLAAQRSLRAGSAHCDVCTLPARAANAASPHRLIFGLAGGGGSSVDIDLGSSAGAYRFTGAEQPAAGNPTRVGWSPTGKKSHPGSLASCSRPMPSRTASRCWCGWRPASNIRLTAMRELRNCICSTVSYGSMTGSLCPGDYNRAERGSADKRVWSETGCTCLLVTSPSDVLS